MCDHCPLPACTRSRPMVVALLAALFVLALSSGAVADEEPSLPDISDAQWDKLHDGEVYVDVDREGSNNRGVVIGIVQEEINDVTPLIARCWEYGDWRDNLKDTSLEENTDGNHLVCGGTAKVPFPARDRHGHFDVHNRSTDVEGTRSFVSTFNYIDDTGNLEDMFGYWVAYPYGDDGEHTMIKHVLNVDLGSWLPDRLIQWATGRTLPNTVIGIRSQLNDNLSEPLYWRDHDYD